MQVSDFYTQKAHNAIQINLVFADKFKKQDYSTKIQNIFTNIDFSAKPGDVAVIFDDDGKVDEVYVGADSTENNYLAAAVNKLPRAKYIVSTDVSENVLLEWAKAQYKFIKYKEDNSSARVLVLNSNQYSRVLAKADACFIVRDLINTPAADMGPKEMANVVSELAAAHNAEFTQISGKDLLKENYPAIYTVGQGSSSESRLLELNWGDKKQPKVTLVGKGVCFDSGGLDIKPSSGMRLMKKDMGGAAQVIGLAKWIMTEQLPINLQVLIPAVENSVDGNSYRPGDVITMRSGLTVEIDNTDAEGRLVLADAITKACEDKTELLIDFATLTGAARIAVGTDLAAMFSNDDRLADEIMQKSALTDDPIWRLPLFTKYNSMLDSNVADIANCSKTGYGGAITAALFLEKFVNAKTPWLHFDVMAWNLSDKPGKPSGGEAMGIFAVGEYLRDKFSLV